MGPVLTWLGFYNWRIPITSLVRRNGGIASERVFPAVILYRKTRSGTLNIPSHGLSTRITILWRFST